MTIFSPIEIGGRIFKNRTVMAPMVVNSAEPDGSVSKEFHDFYLARARGGVGYIVLGGVFVHPEGRGFNGQLGIDRDELIPKLQAFTESIRNHCRIGAQLSVKTIGRPPESLTLDQIREYRQAFTAGALRARDAGFDAVELHACHDYWLHFFLSPYFNHRTDEYGGSLENRFRLVRETVEEIRSAVGHDLVLGARLSLTDFMDGGMDLDESIQIGKWLEELGVDYISASVGIGITQFRMSPPSEVPRATQIPLAQTMQQAVSVPVIGVGRLDRPVVFRGAVEDGHVTMAAAARAMIADPDYVSKMESGREEDIRPCVACNFCLTCLKNGQKVRCAVNPYVGRDIAKPEPLERPLNVTVIGAGPAGLTAAATAAGRGAAVTLIEKRDRPGGALNVAKVPPFKEPLCEFSEYLVRQAKQAGANFRLNSEATADSVIQAEPDRVVVAVGARPAIPRLTCLDETCVITARRTSAAQRRSARRIPGNGRMPGGSGNRRIHMPSRRRCDRVGNAGPDGTRARPNAARPYPGSLNQGRGQSVHQNQGAFNRRFNGRNRNCRYAGQALGRFGLWSWPPDIRATGLFLRLLRIECPRTLSATPTTWPRSTKPLTRDLTGRWPYRASAPVETDKEGAFLDPKHPTNPPGNIHVLLPGVPGTTSRGCLGYCTVCLFQINGEWALFDTGQYIDRALFLEKLKAFGLSPTDINYVVLSHLHFDHVLNLPLLTEAELFVSNAELEHVQLAVEGKAYDPAIVDDWSRYLAGHTLHHVDERMEIAPGLELVLLPGHTPGCLAMFAQDDDQTVAVCGDVIKNAWEAVNQSSTMALAGEAEAAKSIKYILDRADIIIPGHDRPFRMRNGRPVFLAPFEWTIQMSLYPDEADRVVLQVEKPADSEIYKAGQ